LNHTNEKQVLFTHSTKVLEIHGGSSLQGVAHARIWKFQEKRQSISYKLAVLVNRLVVLATVNKLTKDGMTGIGEPAGVVYTIS